MNYKETATQELSTLLTELFDNYRDGVISHKTYEQSKKEALEQCIEDSEPNRMIFLRKLRVKILGNST